MQPLSRDLAEYWSLDVPGGVVIGAVLAGSPAESAGLRPGDVVLAVDGESLPVRETKDLPLIQRRIRRAGAGKDVPLTVWREGLKTDLTVRLVASPTTVATASPGSPNAGISKRLRATFTTTPTNIAYVGNSGRPVPAR